MNLLAYAALPACANAHETHTGWSHASAGAVWASSPKAEIVYLVVYGGEQQLAALEVFMVAPLIQVTQFVWHMLGIDKKVIHPALSF